MVNSDSRHRAPASTRPQLAPGIALLGQFQGSGQANPGYLVRRGDGTMLLLSEIPFVLAKEIDGEKTSFELAEVVSGRLGQHIDADGVTYIVEQKLRPIGVIADATPVAREPRAVLDLAGRAAAISPAVVQTIAKRLEMLFALPVVILVLVGATLSISAIAFSGTDLDQLLSQPGSLLTVVSITLLSALFHEFGHAAASSYGGAEPGSIGVGVYVVWPVLYTDTTESYRLTRGARIRTDLGGVYFNLILITTFGLAHAVTGHGIWAAAAVIQMLLIVYQAVPFIRLDGYYLMSDVTGVPDLFSYMRPALRSLVPGRAPARPVQDLRPRVRWMVKAWALSAAVALGWFLTRLILRMPYIAKSVPTLIQGLWDQMASALLAGNFPGGVAALLVLALIVTQIYGLLILCGRIVRRSHRAVSPVIARRHGVPPNLAP